MSVDDVLHPNGRCTCAGEGRCAWCKTICHHCGGTGMEPSEKQMEQAVLNAAFCGEIDPSWAAGTLDIGFHYNADGTIKHTLAECEEIGCGRGLVLVSTRREES